MHDTTKQFSGAQTAHIKFGERANFVRGLAQVKSATKPRPLDRERI
jgi:hypothetical protein